MVEQQPTRGTQIMRAMVHSALSEISKKGNEWIEVGLGNEIRVDQLDFNKPTSELVSERIKVKPPELSEKEFQVELLKLAIKYNTPLGPNSRGAQDKLNELFEGKIGRRGIRGIQGEPGASTAEAEEFAKQAMAARDEARGFVGQAKTAIDEKLQEARDEIDRATGTIVEEAVRGVTEATAGPIAEIKKTAGQVEQNASTVKGHADRAKKAQEGAEEAARQTAKDKEATGRHRADVDALAKKTITDIDGRIEKVTLLVAEAARTKGGMDAVLSAVERGVARVGELTSEARTLHGNTRDNRDAVAGLAAGAGESARRANTALVNTQDAIANEIARQKDWRELVRRNGLAAVATVIGIAAIVLALYGRNEKTTIVEQQGLPQYIALTENNVAEINIEDIGKEGK